MLTDYWGKKPSILSYLQVQLNSTLKAVVRGFFCQNKCAALLILVCAFPTMADVHTLDKETLFNIPSQRVDLSLIEFAEQAKLTFIFPYEEVKKKYSTSLAGTFTAKEAIELLLTGTGFKANIGAEGQLSIINVEALGATSMYKKNKLHTGILVALASLFGMTEGASAAVEEGKVATDVEVISVTGTRRSLQVALDLKRSSDTQMDVIAASDIGKMPDQDIGDSLQRVTGVQIQRSRNGVASEVAIRGLPENFTRTLYNGNVINTAFGKSRNFSFDTMPAAFVSTIEVHKTSSANLLEGGMSGTVNLRSQRAFDIGKSAFVLSAKAVQEGNSGETNPDISMIFSDLFADDTFGVTVGVNYFKSIIGQQEIGTSPVSVGYSESSAAIDYNKDGDTEDTIQFARFARVLGFEDTRQRSAAFANAEWRPSDNFKLFSEVYYNQYDTAMNRSILLLDMKDQTPGANSITTNFNGVDYFTQFEGNNIPTRGESNPGIYETDLLLMNLEAEYKTDIWTIEAGINVVESNLEQYWNNFNVFGPLVDFTVDTVSGDMTNIVFDDFAATQAALINPDNYVEPQIFRSDFGLGFESNSHAYNFDVTRWVDFSLPAGITLSSVQFGLYSSQDELIGNLQKLSLDPEQVLALSPEGFVLEQITAGSGDWFDGGKSTNGQVPIWLSGDYDAFLAEYTRSEMIAAGTLNPANTPENVREDVLAAYVRVDFEDDSGDFSGNLGLRYVDTKQVSEGLGADLESGLFDDNSGQPSAISLPGGEFVVREKNYDELLPSMNLRYNLDDDHIVRFAAAKVMSRPNKGDLQVGATYNYINESVNTDDPNLEPFRATNFDLSYSWYFAEESLFSAALFYKKLESLVKTVQVPNVPFKLTNQVTGEVTTINLIQSGATNSDESAILKGLELIYQQPFTFLPGILSNTGMQFNYTYIDNSVPESLVASSENSFNVTVYYSDKQWDARLAYSYRDAYLQNESSGVLPALFVKEQQYLVGSVNYQYSEYLGFNLAVTNITDEGWGTEYTHGHMDRYSDYGRRFTGGITLKF
tara:strand:+ start:86033 stop:89167 length:3135 start_codon:yes stop_codon:yes gene_type:complete